MLGLSEDSRRPHALATVLVATPAPRRAGGPRLPHAACAWAGACLLLLFSALAPAQSILEQQAKMRIDASVGLYVPIGKTALPRRDKKATSYAVLRALRRAYEVPICTEYMDPVEIDGFSFLINQGDTLAATVANLAERSGGTMDAREQGTRLVVTMHRGADARPVAMERQVPAFKSGATLSESMLALERVYNAQHRDLPMVAAFGCAGMPGDMPVRSDVPLGGGTLREAVLSLLNATADPALTYSASVTMDSSGRTYLMIYVKQADCRDDFANAEEWQEAKARMNADRARLDAYFAAGSETPKP